MPERFIHSNGGGTIAGVEAAVSSDSRIERGCEIRGASRVSFMSRVRGESIIDSSRIACGVVEQSILLNSDLTYAKVTGSSLNNVIVRGTYEPARLLSVLLEDHVVVEGARVENFDLAGPYLVHSDFSRQPRHFTLEKFGIRLGIIECNHEPGVPRVICGCKCRPIAEWIEKKEFLRRLFMKRHNWHGPEADHIVERIKEWQ